MVSLFRLYLLRATYLMIFIFLTTSIWPGLFHHTRPWSLMHGVACCMLAAMAPLVLLGLRYPLKMLPILFYELAWKAIWLIAIGLPLWQAHRVDPDTMETLKACAFGVVLMLIVIPWRYAFDTFLKAPGDRWGFTKLSPKSTRAVS